MEVPLAGEGSGHQPCNLIRRISLGATDLSDIHYDTARDRLYIISDSNNLLLVATQNGRVIAKYTDLPCDDQEGIAFDDVGNTYIAQDSGGIVKIKWSDK